MATLLILGWPQVNPIKSPGGLVVLGYIETLNAGAESNLARLIIIRHPACYDGVWAQIV